MESSFNQGGRSDLVAFIGTHIQARRWIIAADFNVELQHDAASRVFAFSCFPMVNGYQHAVEKLNHVFPHDFKKAVRITNKHKKFVRGADCFSFVIMVPPPRLCFNEGSRKVNLADAQGLLFDSKNSPYASKLLPEHRKHLNDLYQRALQNSFSLDLFENVLLLATFYTFITKAIASNVDLELVGWFPDRDKMTTICNSAWSSLAHMIFLEAWYQKHPGKKPPQIGLWDHRTRGNEAVYDPLIKVPDFLAATLCRWHLSNNLLALPDGMSRRGAKRYRELIKAWVPENPRLWLGRLFAEDGFYRSSRVIAATTKKRLAEITPPSDPSKST